MRRNASSTVWWQGFANRSRSSIVSAPRAFSGASPSTGRKSPSTSVRVRESLAAFNRHVESIEDKRRSVLGGIRQGRDVLDILDNDLFEAEEAEEQRLNEWIIEREPSALPYRAQQMAWTRGGEEDRQYRKLLALTVLYAVLAGTITQVVDLPLPDAVEIIDVPERLARLIERDERRSVPPPPIAQELPEPVPAEPQPAPEPVVAERPPVNAPAAEEEGAPAPAVAQE